MISFWKTLTNQCVINKARSSGEAMDLFEKYHKFTIDQLWQMIESQWLEREKVKKKLLKFVNLNY